ncbi:hypothetical protein PSACC_01045 [Paramicrosporidium saccamoebae]|uniref:PWI domain-containing protein n=1 Tax=Paramicrosporidium saccamoebae TaxID=1246581 RepID=A0A2H9TMZ6_9FUNG|nr:hypothetical protein PSACC_01045 [Paramicrosporidium saccamoebae]
MGGGSGGTFLPGVKSGDVRYERQQAKLSKSLSTLTRLSLVGVVLPSLRGWMDRRLSELVGISDEVLLELVINTLAERETVEAGDLRVLLTPFMGADHAEKFVFELWGWVGKAKQNGGIPIELEEEYKKVLQEETEREALKGNNGGNNKRYGKRNDNTSRRQTFRSPSRHSPSRHSPSRCSPSSPIRHKSPQKQGSQSSRRQISLSPPRRMHAPATPPGSPASPASPRSPVSSSYSSDDDVTLQLRERAPSCKFSRLHWNCSGSASTEAPGRDGDRWRLDATGNIVSYRLRGCEGCLCHEYDHITPFSKGGKTEVSNCQILQTRVNRYKGNESNDPTKLAGYSCARKYTEPELDIIEASLYGNVKRPGLECRVYSIYELFEGYGHRKPPSKFLPPCP